MKSFVLDFVNHADLNIDDFMFRSKKLESISQRMDDYINRTSSEWNLDIIHKVKNGEEEKLISLPFYGIGRYQEGSVLWTNYQECL